MRNKRSVVAWTTMQVAFVLTLVGLGACAGPIAISRPAEPGAVGIPYSLPRTVTTVTATIGVTEGATPQPTMSLAVATTTVADGACQYVLEHQTSDSSSDQLNVGVGASGLLGTINASSTQEGTAILDAALNTVIAGAKLAASGGAFGLQSTGGVGTKTPGLADVDARMLAELRRVIGTHTIYWPLPKNGYASETITPFPEDPNWTLVMSIEPVSEERRTGDENVAPATRDCSVGEVAGVLVRGIEPFVITAELRWKFDLTKAESTALGTADANALYARNMSKDTSGIWGYHGTLMSATGLAAVPDYSPVAVVPMNRAMFVTVANNLTFTGGVLTGSEVTRPSPIAAVAGFPEKVANALVALPAELVQVRINSLSTATSLATAETTAAAATQTSRATAIDNAATLRNAYLDALGPANAALAAWQAAIGADDEGAKRIAAAKAMYTANDAAAKAGIPAPFASGDFPSGLR